MLSYLDALESESSSWVEATQALLPQVWSTEDFMESNPPGGVGSFSATFLDDAILNPD